MAQMIILAVVISLALGSFLIYKRLDRTYYIEYTESSSSDYIVHYRENTFFEEEWVDAGQSYVSSITDFIETNFHYELHMDTSNVAFDYTYELAAQLVISDKTSGAHIYDPTTVLIPKTTKSVSGSDSFYVDEVADINFASYNTLATQFINTYGLKNAKAALWVTLKVDVLSASDEFDMNNENKHSVTMLIPLCEQNFSIENTTSLPTGESKILACKRNNNQKLFLGSSVALSVLALLLAVVLAAFAYLTKNEDVTYANRVRKILNAYRSFIQRIYGEFDATGYQLVFVKTFTELLGIRDTIQSPVLMCENKDETRSQFLIPTNTKLLYVYEIKVDNYDELYGAQSGWTDETMIRTQPETRAALAVPAEPAITVAPKVEYTPEPIVEIVSADDDDYEYYDYDDEDDDSVGTSNNMNNQIFMDIYKELGKLRQEMHDSEKKEMEKVKETETASASAAAAASSIIGNMKFGHFSAGGNVTINYHEMPEKDLILEAARIFVDNVGGKVHKADETTAKKAEEPAPQAEESKKAEPTPVAVAKPAPVVEEAVEELVIDVVEEATEEPAPEVVEEATEEPAPEVVEEVTEEPAPEVVEEVTEEPAPEVVEPPSYVPSPEQRVNFPLGVLLRKI